MVLFFLLGPKRHVSFKTFLVKIAYAVLKTVFGWFHGTRLCVIRRNEGFLPFVKDPIAKERKVRVQGKLVDGLRLSAGSDFFFSTKTALASQPASQPASIMLLFTIIVSLAVLMPPRFDMISWHSFKKKTRMGVDYFEYAVRFQVICVDQLLQQCRNGRKTEM